MKNGKRGRPTKEKYESEGEIPTAIVKEKPEEQIGAELVKQEIIPFVTTDALLVEKLQNKFFIKNISYNRKNEIRTFEFNISKEEVDNYLKGV